RYASDGFRQKLQATRREVMARLEGYYTGMNIGAIVDGKEVVFNCSELLDLVTNGMIFHEDSRHRPAVEVFAKEPRWSYLLPAIGFKIWPIKQIAGWLFRELWKDGILTDCDYPEAWQTFKRAWEASNHTGG